MYVLAALENARDGVLITSLDGTPLFLNRAFGHFFGFTRETVSEINVFALHGQELVRDALACAADGLTCSHEVTLVGLNGVDCPFGLQCSPIEDDDFEPRGVCWLYADLSEQKRAEQEKLAKEKLQGVIEMGAAACHELNQPLQIVLGQAELMLLSMSAEDPHHASAKSIVEGAKRIAEITHKIHGISRYETMEYSDRRIIDIDSASGG